MLEYARPGATFLLNSPWGPDEVWDHLPIEVQHELIAKHIDMWVIDAYRVAREAQMGNRVNTVMQPCFFVLSGVLPAERGDRPHQGRRSRRRTARAAGRSWSATSSPSTCRSAPCNGSRSRRR